MSTDKKKGFHKPCPGLWDIFEQQCNGGTPFQVQESFYVGDSVGDDNDAQGGGDIQFAQTVSKQKGTTLKFYTPEEYFGPSDAEQRKKQSLMDDYDEPPQASLQARAALFGGYLKAPIMLVLCGAQGSGKSTFCTALASSDHWLHLNQDTINSGKPGNREEVEKEATKALTDGLSVVIDRMHLIDEQRSHFVDIAIGLKVPVHALVLNPPKDVIAARVRNRSNHPAGVEGEKGARIALSSIEKLSIPKYNEKFNLVSCVATDASVDTMVLLYKKVGSVKNLGDSMVLPVNFKLANDTEMPSIALGTMGIGKRVTNEVVSLALDLGWKAIDTAPTYNNESEMANSLKSGNPYVIIKVPKRATQPEQVVDEVNTSLSKLKKKSADLLLLHWPCDVIEAGTLKEVWQEMENCLKNGLCRSLGVCNFSVDALRQLLPHCTIAPCVNQVERHPLLKQWELLNFCANNNILLQAHTPLGQGKEKLLKHKTVTAISKEAGLSSAQLVLKWNLQHGVAIVPKCSTKQHLEEAQAILKGKPLTSDQMKFLDNIEDTERFVSPPFMNKPGSLYSWIEKN